MTELELDAYLEKHISDICHTGFTDNAVNHCAHFVSHALGLKFGITCRTMAHGEGEAASIRVQEIFPHCPEVGTWNTLSANVRAGLVFITRSSNVNLEGKSMANVPRKHVGIFCGNQRKIWHYSNSKDKVICQTVEQFTRHYPSPDNAMFWGTFPHGRRCLPPGTTG
jgi:hypothetical protein